MLSIVNDNTYATSTNKCRDFDSKTPDDPLVSLSKIQCIYLSYLAFFMQTWEIEDPEILRVTYRGKLDEEEKKEIQSGSTWVYRPKIGLYMPEFSDDYIEERVTVYFDKDSTWTTNLLQYDIEQIYNPCEPYLPPPITPKRCATGVLCDLPPLNDEASFLSLAASTLAMSLVVHFF